MKTLLGLVLLLAACDQTPLVVPPVNTGEMDGRWTSPWVVAGSDDEGEYSTRYVLVFVEDNVGHCTAQLSCECTNPAHTPAPPGMHFWEGDRSSNVISMQSTNIVTGESGTLTGTVQGSSLTVQFSWGEALTFVRASG